MKKQNALLELLDADGDRSIANLKRRFRQLCKETHPDLAGTGHEGFIALGAEYRVALAVLRSGPKQEAARSDPSPADPRRTVLLALRTYAFRFWCGDSELLLERLMVAASAYDARRRRLLEAYKLEFLDSVHAWMAEGRVYYAHSLILAAVKQLFYFYGTGAARHRILLERYTSDAKKRAERLEDGRRSVLNGFAEWLLDEAGRPPVIPED
ncbi:MAG: hypothetical protein A2Z99_20600 [Treponema sp. GWB1_62_6]|nr:MAG: hypothetical protein A2Z99_20600 [Treponema sp. GWB1_62_6]